MGKKRKERGLEIYRQDEHHLFYMRKEWKGGYAKVLRDYDYCRIYIPKYTLHTEIHANVREIPRPTEGEAWNVLTHLIHLEQCGELDYDDPIEERLRLLIALFGTSAPSTVEALRRQLEVVNEFKKSPP